jgi:hypothetical protein
MTDEQNYTPQPPEQQPEQPTYQQQPYQQPPYQQPYQQPPVDPGKGLSIAALVLGICGFVVPFGGLVCSIVGLILGLQGKKKSEAVGIQSGIAKAGIILSIIGIALSVLWIVLCVGLIGTAASSSLYY